MKGYIISTVKNTHGLVAYDNDISIDYKEFLKGQFFPRKRVAAFLSCSKKVKFE